MCIGAAPKPPEPQRPMLPTPAPKRVDEAAKLARERGGIAEQMRRGLLSTYGKQTPALLAPAAVAGKKLFGE